MTGRQISTEASKCILVAAIGHQLSCCYAPKHANDADMTNDANMTNDALHHKIVVSFC